MKPRVSSGRWRVVVVQGVVVQSAHALVGDHVVDLPVQVEVPLVEVVAPSVHLCMSPGPVG